jgi:hypothetical protein
LDLLVVQWRQKQAREDRRAAMASWILVNVNRDSEKHAEPFSLGEVVSWLGHGFQREAKLAPPPPAQERASVEELVGAFDMMKRLNDVARQQGRTEG